MNHPNITAFKESYMTKSSKMNIVMEYANGGTLRDLIHDKMMVSRLQKQSLQYWTETQILDWFAQICLPIKYIHDRKILHRDLKPINIFLTENRTVKLGDFGVSKILETTNAEANTYAGTRFYLSPEIIGRQPYNQKTDIWSLGVVLYEMCALHRPFAQEQDDINLSQLCDRILNGDFDPIPE